MSSETNGKSHNLNMEDFSTGYSVNMIEKKDNFFSKLFRFICMSKPITIDSHDIHTDAEEHENVFVKEHENVSVKECVADNFTVS